MNEKKCLNCKKDISRTRKRQKCCSPSCASEYSKIGKSTGKKILCTNCKTLVYKRISEIKKSKTGNLFCSRSCAASFNNLFRDYTSHSNYRGGYSEYRKRAFETKPNVCNRCGYKKVPGILQVHHIDRNRENSDISNLEILCPNCHEEDHFESGDGRFAYIPVER